MPRFSALDRELTDGPWPRGLNDDSNVVNLGEGEVPLLMDCDISLTGGITKRQGLDLITGLIGNNNDRSVCILIDYLHDFRIVLGVLHPNNPGNDAFTLFDRPTNVTFKLYALTKREFISGTTLGAAIISADLDIGDGYLNYPSVVRTGGKTYIAAFNNIIKWSGSAWSMIAHNESSADSEAPYDKGMFGYWTRKNAEGVPTAVSNIAMEGFQRDVAEDDGGGGFPNSNLIGLYQVGDRQVVLSAHDDKIRYSFPTPYGAGAGEYDSAVYGPQDWLEEAWMDVGESTSSEYVTAFQQVEDTLFIFKRSSIWMVHGDLSPGGLGVRKLHDGIGARHAHMVTQNGSRGLVFFDLVTNSLWAMDAGGGLTDLWNQRIKISLDGAGSTANFLFNSFVTSYHNKIYTSLPHNGVPRFRTYVTDVTTGSITLWSFGSSYMIPVEFRGKYGLVSATRITGYPAGGVEGSDPGEDGNISTAITWIDEVSRSAVAPPDNDELGTVTAQVRPFVAKVSFKAFMPSVSTGETQADWSAVRPKWRGGYITVTATEAVSMTVRLDGSAQTISIPVSATPMRLPIRQTPASNESSIVVDVDLPDGVTLHQVSMRYWRRR